MSVGAAIAIGAVVGLALGIVVSVTTEIPCSCSRAKEDAARAAAQKSKHT
jgi:hypothetical protein